MVFVMTTVVLVLSPFAIYEWITGNKPILWASSTIFRTVEVTTMTPRWGFWRVQGPFSHSIEFGLFCTSIIAMTHLVWGYSQSFASRWLLTASVAGTSFLSMSSAAVTCLTFQVFLIGYNWLFGHYKRRWMILWMLAALAFLVAQFGSNLGAVKYFISHFTFDAQTGWYRLAIWDFGTASVENHPLLGIGLAEWERPPWMPADSVDNFWLSTAMRYGIPSVLLLFGSCIWMVLGVAHAKCAERTIEICRLAYLICMATFLFVGVTIHFAHAIYAWFMFALGSGAWLLESKRREGSKRTGLPAQQEQIIRVST
jgi:O-antigen ligase